MNLTLSQIEFCAEECKRQKSGETSVFWMCEAFAWVKENCTQLTTRMEVIDVDKRLQVVHRLAKLIEPEKNRNGFRGTEVHFRNMSFGLKAELIPQAMKNLLEAWNELDADQFYLEFQKIHPYIDGNGRTGALLYILNKFILDNPVAPPDFFKVEIN